jgi:hypothetical protein
MIKTTLLLPCGLLFLCASTSSNATTIFLDTFSAAENTLIANHTPDTNLPSANYYVPNNGWTPSKITNSSMAIDTDNKVVISLNSAGAYTQPNKLFVSADLKIAGIESDTEYPRGIWMGFCANQISRNDSGFSGLILGASGELSLIQGGSMISSIAYQGAWNPNDYHQLQYSYDSTTHAIGDISLFGSNADYSSFSSMTVNPNYLVIRVSDSQGGHAGFIDNLTVADSSIPLTVPEPSAFAMLGLGTLGLVVRRRRKA